MAIGIIPATATNYPQTGGHRTWGQFIVDVARRVGGENDDGRIGYARAACESAVRAYNVVLWKFNQTSEDITLVTATDSYGLNAYHAAPVRAYLLNATGKQTGTPLQWVDYPALIDSLLIDDTVSGNPPLFYSSKNHHALGTIILRPVPINPSTGGYPTLRVVYLTRIEIPGTDVTPLDVPVEVEHGIERWAAAEVISIVQGPGKGSQMMSDAVWTKTELEARYRAFPDH